MALPINLQTVTNSAVLTTFEAVQIALPNRTVNLLAGASEVVFDVDGVATKFVGQDGVFGQLAAIGQVNLSMEASAPVWKLEIDPPTTEATTYLTQPEVQGSKVRLWWGALDPSNGAIIGTFQLWKGKLDTATITLGQGSQRVEIDVTTPSEALFNNSEGERLTVAWQQLHFPGAKGLEWNVSATEQPFWGSDVTRNTVGGGSGGSGGSGGGGVRFSGSMLGTIVNIIQSQQV